MPCGYCMAPARRHCIVCPESRRHLCVKCDEVIHGKVVIDPHVRLSWLQGSYAKAPFSLCAPFPPKPKDDFHCVVCGTGELVPLSFKGSHYAMFISKRESEWWWWWWWCLADNACGQPAWLVVCACVFVMCVRGRHYSIGPASALSVQAMPHRGSLGSTC